MYSYQGGQLPLEATRRPPSLRSTWQWSTFTDIRTSKEHPTPVHGSRTCDNMCLLFNRSVPLYNQKNHISSMWWNTCTMECETFSCKQYRQFTAVFQVFVPQVYHPRILILIGETKHWIDFGEESLVHCGIYLQDSTLLSWPPYLYH